MADHLSRVEIAPDDAPAGGPHPDVDVGDVDVMDDDWQTIDELAQATGVTVRNIRAHQARGLLPSPVVRARTGYYGPEHRARLALVQELQGEGVKLDTIRKLLDTTGGSTEQVLHFLRAVRQLFGEAEGDIVSLEDLGTRFRTEDLALLRRAEKLGLVRRLDDEQFQEVSPRLVRVGQELVEMGIPLGRNLDVVSALQRHAEGVAKTYVDLFLEEVWRPFDASGRPDDQWPRVHESILALRRIADEALLAVLEAAVAQRLDVTFGKEITRNVRSTRPKAVGPAGKLGT